MKITVLFLGNPIFSDDAIGIEVGRRLINDLKKIGIDVYILERTGLSLIDYIVGYDLVIIVDSFKINQRPPGEVTLSNFLHFSLPIFSPHYAGVSEALMVSQALGIRNNSIYVIAIEVYDPYTLGEGLSREIADKIEKITSDVYGLIMNIINRVVDKKCNQE